MIFELIVEIAPAAAALFAWQAIRQVKSLWHAERLSGVYRTVAREPIIRARDDFIADIRKLLEDNPATEQRKMDGALRVVIHRYRAALREARSIDVVDLDRFADCLIRAAEDVEDELTMLLAIPEDHVATRERKRESLLAKHSARVLDIIAKNDPALPKPPRKIRDWLRALSPGSSSE